MGYRYQNSSRCEKDISLLWRNHICCGLNTMLISLNSCVLPTEGVDSSWFSTSQHVTRQSIRNKLTSFHICTTSLVSRPFINLKKWPGNLSEFKLLTSAALELAVPIRFQNAPHDSCGISLHHKYITV